MILSHSCCRTSWMPHTGDCKSSSSRDNASVTALRKGVKLFLRTSNCLKSSCGMNVIYSHSFTNEQQILAFQRFHFKKCSSFLLARETAPMQVGRRRTNPCYEILGMNSARRTSVFRPCNDRLLCPNRSNNTCYLKLQRH